MPEDTENPQPEDSENIEPEEEAEVTGESVPSYSALVVEEAERPVILENYAPPKTLGEEEEDSSTLSDFKAALRAITPRFKNERLNELLQPAMMSRVFPDNYTDKLFLLSAALIEEGADDPKLDVVGIISQVQDALSIGYEGRHIVDISELFGVTREQDMERLAKDLGLGS